MAAPRRGQAKSANYQRLLERMAESALRHVCAQQLAGEYLDFAATYDRQVWWGFKVLNNYRYATSREDDPVDDVHWHHDDSPFNTVRFDLAPRLDRQSLGGVAEDYLQLPYRCEEFERLLIDALVACEVYAYGELMIPKKKERFPVTPLRPRTLVGFVLGQVIMLLLAALLWGAAFGLNTIGVLPSDWFGGTSVIIWGLWLLAAAWDAVTLPLRMISAWRNKKEVQKLLLMMAGVYSELDPPRPFSARHIDARAREASSAGVVWPPALFVLLDDLIARPPTRATTT